MKSLAAGLGLLLAAAAGLLLGLLLADGVPPHAAATRITPASPPNQRIDLPLMLSSTAVFFPQTRARSSDWRTSPEAIGGMLFL